MDKSQRLSYWYLIPPVLTFVLILPPILELPPFHPADNRFQMLITLPFYFGLAAAPGYVYAWRSAHSWQRLGQRTRLWISISLICSTAASFAGTWLSVMTVIVAPFALWSFVMSLKLCLRWYRSGSNH